MIVFKTVDEYSREDGKKIGERKIAYCRICDFTGEIIDPHSNPNTYNINFNNNDPCFGDHEAEKWFYRWCEDELEKDDNFEGAEASELFGQSSYIFKTENDGTEVFSDLLAKAKEEKFEIISLDHLLRWSRGRMLQKFFKEGDILIENLIG